METASAVYVQIKHQLLWASVPLLTCGWNIRCGKGQLRDYKWNCFRLFHQMSHDAGDIPLVASKDTPRPLMISSRSRTRIPMKIEPPFHKALFQRSQKSLNQTIRNYLISFSDCRPKALMNNQTKVLLSSPCTLWVLSTHQERVNSASIENHGKRCD